jgi:hypothetical protein
MSALLATAEKLLTGKVSDADMRRAVSTIYYAIFHHLCERHSDQLVADKSLGAAMLQAYRSVEHGLARTACIECRVPGKCFPKGVLVYADVFSRLQDLRHKADYDPTAAFNIYQAHALINDCRKAIAAFDAEPERHKRAFVVFVALKRRGKP